MSRYQIRTSENTLEDVLNEMASAGWEAIQSHLTDAPTTGNLQEFKKTVSKTVMPYIHAFRLCGKSNICLDEVRLAPLSTEPQDVDVHPWDLVYHIFFRGNAEEFVEVVAFEAVESMKNQIRANAHTAFIDVCGAMREVLGKYLFYSSVCGRTELCIFSSSSPIEADGRR